ncbi:hypothetical protein Pmani_003573 [Petrolisthes manimaculis]|uniref:Metalloendopeptidase n=1 Tax=Petrolisthes manimaculis TaxID=1843537 RepID=A0AAE1QFF1_9EUCA|nr:hypothetical protein Pmani_003573 [Petrolisthes manimaculis]
MNGNPKEVNGKKLFENDIMLTEEQRTFLEERKFQTNSDLYMWPYVSGSPLVPYTLHSSLDTESTDAILEAIDNWEANTCLRFQPATTTLQPHLNFVKENGCRSYVGRIYNWPGQKVSIGPGCENVGIAIHEIGHAIGFYHEQSRSDRDHFIHVNKENIVDGVESNFDKHSTVTTVPFDYSSIMHYSLLAGSKNGLPTISAIDPLDNYLIQRIGGLTFRDKLLANIMYDCIVHGNLQCAIKIIAPDCTKPRLTFTSFDLLAERTCDIGSCCRFENLQFMVNYPESSTPYCGTDISPGQVFDFDTQEVVIFHFRHGFFSTPGWSADLTFPTDPRCVVQAEGDCTLEFDDILSTYNWKSPDFDGTTDYPTAIECTEDMTGMPNTMLYLSSDSFNVGTPSVNGECTDDYIEINHLFGKTEKFCGSDPISFTSPSSAFSMKFYSNDVDTATGFDISMEMTPNSAFNCHQDIVLNSGQRYVLNSPDFKLNEYENLNCEYNFKAPEGKKIKILTLLPKLLSSTDCTSDFLVLNGDGNRMYPTDSSYMYCDYTERSHFLTTNTNTLLVAYQKTDLNSKGFKLVVKAT